MTINTFQLQPLQQGNLDGLCGIYAVVNALRIARSATRPLTNSDEHKLFEMALFKMAETHEMPLVVRHGMSWKSLKRLAKHLNLQASLPNARLGIERLSKKLTPHEREEWFVRQFTAERPLVVFLQRQAHYSVVVGCTRKSFRLFDSNGRRWTLPQAITKAFAIATETGV